MLKFVSSFKIAIIAAIVFAGGGVFTQNPDIHDHIITLDDKPAEGVEYPTNRVKPGTHSVKVSAAATALYNNSSYRFDLKMDNINNELYWIGYSIMNVQAPRTFSACVT